VPRWKTPRWTLGAPALVALAVAGCGASASQPKLHSSSEKRLLSLVQSARTDAAHHDGSAVNAALGEFVSEVRTLTTSGQLSATTAGKLDQQARSTARQAAQQLHPAAKVHTNTTTTTAQTVATTTQPATVSSPATRTPPPPVTQSDPGQGDTGSGSPRPGHHRYDHGDGHGRWASGSQGDVAQAWAKWWSGVTGGQGD
jgi:hypothetical protein